MMAEHIFLLSWTWQATSHKIFISKKKNFFYLAVQMWLEAWDLAQMTEMLFHNYTDFGHMSD